MGVGQGTGRDHLMQTGTDEAWAFNAYQAVRARLPKAGPEREATHHATLADIADRYDVILLDSFGVLNIGDRVIPGAPERVAALQAMGKRVIVVTNAAGYPKRLLLQRFGRLGFSFSPEDVVSSRETLLAHLKNQPARHWGLMASTRFGREEFEHLDATFLAEDPADYACRGRVPAVRVLGLDGNPPVLAGGRAESKAAPGIWSAIPISWPRPKAACPESLAISRIAWRIRPGFRLRFSASPLRRSSRQS